MIFKTFFLKNMKEGYTSCSQFKSCDACVGGKVGNTSSSCYWSNSKKLCGSFQDVGYSSKCEPEQCTPCPKLTKLKNDTYITQQ